MLIAAFFVVVIHVALIFACLRERPLRKNWIHENVVYLPFFLAGVGMVCGTVMGIPTVVCAIDKDWMFAFFGAFVLLCDLMMVAYLNCVIRYDDKGFYGKNMLGIGMACSYGEVEGIRSGKDSRIYFRGRSLMIDEISIGRVEFIVALEKGYKQATGNWVPIHKRKWDPMNGHLEYPWLYFILWVTMGSFCLALPVMMFVSMISKTDPATITIRNVQFSSYDTYEGALRLYVEGEEKPYKINYFKHYGEVLPSAEELCNGEVYAVGVVKDGRSIKSLTDANGKKYITLESEQQIYRDSQMGAVCFLLVASIAGAYFCYLGIAVGRHPERYSEKVRRLIYKDGYLN